MIISFLRTKSCCIREIKSMILTGITYFHKEVIILIFGYDDDTVILKTHNEVKSEITRKGCTKRGSKYFAG